MKRRVSVILSILMFMISIVGCSNKLETENRELKQKITELEAKVKQLSETDQYYFNRAVDLMNNAVSTGSKVDYGAAVEAFGQLIHKYPLSLYIGRAKENIANANKRISIIVTIENSIHNINDSMSNHEYARASSELRKIRGMISKEQYSGISKRIYEEANKPLDISVRSIVAEPMKYYEKRVKIGSLIVVNNNLKRGSFDTCLATERGWDSDAFVEVFYKNMKNRTYWRDLSADPGRIRISVIGVFKPFWDNIDKGYIDAQEITIINM